MDDSKRITEQKNLRSETLELFEACNKRFERDEILSVMRSSRQTEPRRCHHDDVVKESVDQPLTNSSKEESHGLRLRGGSIFPPMIPDCVCTECQLKPDCCIEAKAGAVPPPSAAAEVHCDCGSICECTLCEEGVKKEPEPPYVGTCPCDDCTANDYNGDNGVNSCVCMSASLASQDPSVFSIGSTDLFYMSKLEELAARDRKMKMRICELEHREKAYMETLQQADEMWAAMEDCYKKRLSSVKQDGDSARDSFEQMSIKLTEENSRLSDEVKDLRLELKQCMERVQGPMTRQLEQEKRRCENLESQLAQATRSMKNKQNTYQGDLSCLQDELNNTCSCMYEMSALNEQLKNDNATLHCKYNQLQQDLVVQKINEAHTLKQLNDALEEARARIAELTKVPEEKACADYTLNELARCLSKTLMDLQDCDNCRCIPNDFKVTVEAIKKLVDLVDSQKAEDDDDKKGKKKKGGGKPKNEDCDGCDDDDDDNQDGPGGGASGGGGRSGRSGTKSNSGGGGGNDDGDDGFSPRGNSGGETDYHEPIPARMEMVPMQVRKALPPGEGQIEVTTEVEAREAMKVKIDTEIHEIDEMANTEEVTITTTVTKSGILEVVTEGPLTIIETKMIYAEEGRIEIATEIIDKGGNKKAAGDFPPKKKSMPSLMNKSNNELYEDVKTASGEITGEIESNLMEEVPATGEEAEESVDAHEHDAPDGDYRTNLTVDKKVLEHLECSTVNSVLKAPAAFGDCSELCSAQNITPPTQEVMACMMWNDNPMFEKYFEISSFGTKTTKQCERRDLVGDECETQGTKLISTSHELAYLEILDRCDQKLRQFKSVAYSADVKCKGDTFENVPVDLDEEIKQRKPVKINLKEDIKDMSWSESVTGQVEYENPDNSFEVQESLNASECESQDAKLIEKCKKDNLHGVFADSSDEAKKSEHVTLKPEEDIKNNLSSKSAVDLVKYQTVDNTIKVQESLNASEQQFERETLNLKCDTSKGAGEDAKPAFDPAKKIHDELKNQREIDFNNETVTMKEREITHTETVISNNEGQPEIEDSTVVDNKIRFLLTTTVNLDGSAYYCECEQIPMNIIEAKSSLTKIEKEPARNWKKQQNEEASEKIVLESLFDSKVSTDQSLPSVETILPSSCPTTICENLFAASEYALNLFNATTKNLNSLKTSSVCVDSCSSKETVDAIKNLEQPMDTAVTKRYNSAPVFESPQLYEVTKRPITEPKLSSRERRRRALKGDPKEKIIGSASASPFTSFTNLNDTINIEHKRLIDEIQKNLGESTDVGKDRDTQNLKDTLEEIKCSCYEARIIAQESTHFNSVDNVGTCFAYRKTLSELQLALLNLQNRCQQKDFMIEQMMQNLKARPTNTKVSEEPKYEFHVTKESKKEVPNRISRTVKKIAVARPHEEKAPIRLNEPPVEEPPTAATIDEIQIEPKSDFTVQTEKDLAKHVRRTSKSPHVKRKVKKSLPVKPDTTNDKMINVCMQENFAQQNVMMPTIIHYVPLPKHHRERSKSTVRSEQPKIAKITDESMQTMAPMEVPNSCAVIPQEGLNATTSISAHNVEITETRLIHDKSVLIKWTKPICLKELTGFEITVDGIFKSKLHSPKRTAAIIHDFPETKSRHQIALYCLCKKGRRMPPAFANFQL